MGSALLIWRLTERELKRFKKLECFWAYGFGLNALTQVGYLESQIGLYMLSK